MMSKAVFAIPFVFLFIAVHAGGVFAQEADLAVEFRPQAPVLETELPQDWVMVVRNLGPLATDSVTLDFEMLGELQVLSVDPAELCEMTTVPGGQRWTCTLGSLAAGDSTLVTWEVVSRDEGAILDLIWAATHSLEDPDPKNDQGQRSIAVVPPHRIDLQVAGEMSASVVTSGLDGGGHRLDIVNAGPETAYAVTLTDMLPSGWIVTEVLVEGLVLTTEIIGSTVTCFLDSLPSGAGGLVYVGFEPVTEGWHTFTAGIDGYGDEADMSNNASVDSVLVLPQPDYVVNTTDDVDDGTCDDVHCSLREAIRMAGRIGPLGGGIVAFRIPGPAPHVIQPQTAYLNIQNDIVLDGWYQMGFDGTPLVEVDGSAIATVSSGLAFFTGASGAVVRGLAIGGFNYMGISFATDSLTVEGCYLGLRTDGSTPLPNLRGIGGGMNGTRVGGPTPWQRNVISGNDSDGIFIIGTAFGGSIIGNYIGTDANGTEARPNFAGIRIGGGGGLTIGGLDPAEGNLVSGNGEPGSLNGIGILGDNTVEATIRILNNLIGCDVTGEAPLPNQGAGILLQGGGPFTGQPLYQVGAPGAGNVVSGNGGSGIDVGSGATEVLANHIGVSASGTASLPNGHWGLTCRSSLGRLGRPGAGNLIGINSGVSLVLTSGADACTVQANMVGIGAGGVELAWGITQIIGADDLLFGGSGPGEGNVFPNLQVSGGTNQVFQGNMIGVKGDGVSSFMSPPGSAFYLTGSNVLLGGTGPGEGNVIGGATGYGLSVAGGPDIVVQGNSIGVGIDGTTPVPNAIGLQIGSLFLSTIGGPGAGNHIAFNTSTGIRASGGGYSDVEIVENSIHHNEGDGVWLDVADEGPYGGPYGQIGIHRNAIYRNDGLGIDLGNNGPDPIDPLDGDNGDNGQQNSVTITLAEVRGDSLDISAILTSHPDADYEVEFFLNSFCDPTLKGEGELYLGKVDLRTFPSGDGFVLTTFFLEEQTYPYLTATVTDSLDQTSEFSNCWTIIGISGVEDQPPAPLGDRLMAAYPNPFNPSTVLRWEQAGTARAELAVYDLMGRRVAGLSAGRLPPGQHELPWAGLDAEGRGLPSGVYLVRLKLDGRLAGATRKIMLLR